MKQIVGGTFCGYQNVTLEHEIIHELVVESERCEYELMKSETYNQRRIRASAQKILSKLQKLLSDRLEIYLQAIVNRLFNPEVALGPNP